MGEGGSSCTGDTCTVSIRDATKVSVAFNKIPDYDLVVTKVGDGDGTVKSQPGLLDCGAKCDDKFREGALVTLSATAGSKSFFSSWGGACQSFGNNSTCAVTMDGLKAVTATFTKVPDYSVAVTLSGMGLVTSDPTGIDCPGSCIKAFTQGTMVTLTATPASGWRWVQWSGAPSCGTSTTCTMSVDGARSVTAAFMQIPSYQLAVTLQGDGMGRITGDKRGTGTGIDCGSACSDSYQEGTVVTLTAETGPQSEFRGWTGDALACGTNSTCTIPLDAQKNVTATFMLMPLLTLIPAGDGAGTVTSMPSGINCSTAPASSCTARFPSGTQVKLTEMSQTGSSFAGWGGPNGSSCRFHQDCALTLLGSSALTATFLKLGATQWLMQVGAPLDNDVRRVAVDPNGDIVLAGTYNAATSLGSFPLPSLGPWGSFFVAKLSPGDATIIWAKGFSASTIARFGDVTLDPQSGDIVVVGSFSGTLDLGGPQPLNSPALEQPFIARVSNTSGAHVWSRKLTSSSSAGSSSAVIDASDRSVVLTGAFSGSIELGNGSPYFAIGGVDMFLARYSFDNGELMPSTARIIGTVNGPIYPRKIGIDGDRNVLVAGIFQNNHYFGGSTLYTSQGYSDAFLAKYSSSGALIWAMRGGGPDADFVHSLSIASDNSVLLAGQVGYLTSSDVVDFAGQVLPAPPGLGPEAIVMRVSASGVPQWVRQFGDTANSELARGVSEWRTADGTPYVLSGISAPSVVVDDFSFTTSIRYDGDAYLVMFDWSTGQAVWADQYGASDVDDIWDLAVDPVSRHILACGSFVGISSNFGTTQFGDKTLTSVGGADGYCARIIPGID